jgi:nucleosome assembly protein 1-like 1
MAASTEETRIVESLEALDAEYIIKQTALNKEIKQLKATYAKEFEKIVESRSEILAGTTQTAEGSSALPGFWLGVLANAEEFEGLIEEHDQPILRFLDDIQCEDINPEDSDLGFKVHFIFKENEYFENTKITKVIKTEKASEYIDQVDIIEITTDDINWKAGKDVTVEIVKSKKTGNKKKPAKATPRDSFFRCFFRNLGEGHDLPEEVEGDEDEDEDEEDLEERMNMYIQQDYELSTALRDYIVPHAIKWYTGEANQYSDDEDDDEDEEDDGEELNGEEAEELANHLTEKLKALKLTKGGAEQADQPKEDCKQQ